MSLEKQSGEIADATWIAAGKNFGPYLISGVLGTGGMGKVFRATDTRLNREVAIKVSANKFGERFDREARAVAALNHPNVCTLHDVGQNYLVMELVEGATLADRIEKGPIPLNEALAIARQIAEALEAAHEKGIVHRDLKPSNVKIRPDGVVKVLDFGLAQDAGTASRSSDNSPTVVTAATEAGVILGTAPYMAPEQATGKAVDRRADIWSFGVVLYEMLTGKRLFAGDTRTEVLASVLKDEPQWHRVPVQVHRLLRRCLERDPQKRLRHIADVMALIDDAPTRLDEVPARSSTQGRWLGAAAVLVVLSAIFAFIYFRPKLTDPARQQRFNIAMPENATVGPFTISPDGQRLAFWALGAGSALPRIWIRTLDSLESHPVSETEGANPRTFWSPDGRFLGFAVQGKLKKLDAFGGPPQTICDLPGPYGGGSWNADGVIIYGSTQGIMRVAAAGGTPVSISALDAKAGEQAHIAPSFLPDGKHFLYLRVGGPNNFGAFVGSIDAKPAEQSSTRVLATPFVPAVVPSHDSEHAQVLFLREGTLLSQIFDMKQLQFSGEPIPIAEQVGGNSQNFAGFFSASGSGVLVYRVGATGEADISQPTWVDRQGKILDTPGEPKAYTTLVLSPDATRASVTFGNDLWVLDLSKGTSIRLTSSRSIAGSGTAATSAGVWSPDGSRIAYVANSGGVNGVYQRPSNGSGNEELLWKGAGLLGPSHWSSDGRFLLFGATGSQTSADSWVLSMQGDRTAYPLLQSEFAELGARFSPDGRWVAYRSNESGRNEIYVQPFNADRKGSIAPSRSIVSKGGSIGMPRWRSDSKELYYLANDGKIMVVDIATSPEFRAGEPKLLFQTPPNFVRGNAPGSLVDATADGKRFMLLVPMNRGGSQEQFTVVLNWNAALNNRK
jgi:serine/threonine protein kinase